MDGQFQQIALPISAIEKTLAYRLHSWDMLCLYATTNLVGMDNNPV